MSDVVNLGKGVKSQWWICRQTSIPIDAAIGSQCKLMNRCVTCVLFGLL